MGATCVIFFFCLSGYVLTHDKRNSFDLKWIIKRLIRLMPIYYLSWGLPIFLMLVLNSIYLPDRLGIILGAFGLQSFSGQHYLDQPNPPPMVFIN
jgi:peptidoglycan/LPS O-acetylase OafA/YrhL